jgi:hypothetical protein
VAVQSTLVEKNTKVLKNRGKLTRLHRDMFESFDSIWCTKNSLKFKNVSSEKYTLGEFAATLAASL